MTFRPSGSAGYNGQRISVVNEESVCYIQANAVVIIGNNQRKDFLISPKYGYTCCAANAAHGFIAAAEYGIDNEVHIYKAQTL